MMAVYHAFHCGKMNQSYRMEDERNQSVYEANLTFFKLLGASEYEFINRITSSSSVHKIGKTVSVSEGAGNFSIETASWFKLDGSNCFDILKEKGYSIKMISISDLLHPEFALIDAAGNHVAVYKMNVSGEKEDGVSGIGNKQSNTMIATENKNLDDVFLGAFILGRVEYSLYLT